MNSTHDNTIIPNDLSDNVTIAHTPLIAKNRLAIGTRLIITAREPMSAGDIAKSFDGHFRAFHSVIFLGFYDATYDESLLSWDAPKNVVLEIPGSEFNHESVQDLVRKLHKNGVTLAIRGRAAKPLPPEFVEIFKYSVMHASEEKRVKHEVDSKILAMRKIRFVMTGIASVADVDEAFERGAVASGGWPMDEPPTEDVHNFRISRQTLEKLQRLARDRADHREIESVIKQDPALTFKFLRHLNTGGFGNALKISKFRHAFLIVGYSNLSRWLEGQINTAQLQEDNVFPLMHASLRRGLFMERLCPPDSQSYDAYFLTGAFSLLDRITKTSFARLLSMISVAKEIAESISTADGQWSGHIHLVNAIEQNDVPSIVSHSKELGLRLADVNRALLSALAAAEDIESEDFLRNTELDNARPV